MAKVLKNFRCKVTKVLYKEGAQYEGDRLEELQELGFIEQTKEANNEWPKHVGGGNYELSNGDKVKGKDAALEAQAKIDAHKE